MLDSHLAQLYQVETKYLNRAVTRNKERFPDSFRFQLSKEEFENLKFQIGTSSNNNDLRSQIGTSSSGHGGRRYMPYVFTEQGVAMLSSVLRSNTAVMVSIQIMQTFVEIRKFISTNAGIFSRLDMVELKLLETDQKFEKVFKALESKDAIPKQGVFFDGQVFDAHTFISGIMRDANKSIVLIDNYIDDTDVYHFGASLKDLGKKWFAFSKLDAASVTIIQTIRELI